MSSRDFIFIYMKKKRCLVQWTGNLNLLTIHTTEEINAFSMKVRKKEPIKSLILSSHQYTDIHCTIYCKKKKLKILISETQKTEKVES